MSDIKKFIVAHYKAYSPGQELQVETTYAGVVTIQGSTQSVNGCNQTDRKTT